MTILKPQENIVILSDVLLAPVAFVYQNSSAGILYRKKPFTPYYFFDIYDAENNTAVPYICQFVLEGISVEDGYKVIEDIQFVMQTNGLDPNSFTKVLIALSFANEKKRKFARRQPASIPAETVCYKMKQFLISQLTIFPQARIIWLGCGFLKEKTELGYPSNLFHIKNIYSLATHWEVTRYWGDERIHFQNAFENFDDNDIVDDSGALSMMGCSKACSFIKTLL